MKYDWPKAIKVLLVMNQMTQADVAEKIFLSRKQFNRYCTGNVPFTKIDMLMRVADALNVTFSDFVLLAEEEDDEPTTGSE